MGFIAKHKTILFLLLGLISIGVLVNSCKKNTNDTVAYFLTSGAWQLASVQRFHFVGDTLKTTDTLNTTCQLKQIFQFNGDNSCTYTNYHCLTQTSSGTWQIGSDNLSLQTTMMANDTLNNATVDVAAFVYAQIINLGQYSMVLQTGDVSSYYTTKTKRVIFKYGFVHAIQ